MRKSSHKHFLLHVSQTFIVIMAHLLLLYYISYTSIICQFVQSKEHLSYLIFMIYYFILYQQWSMSGPIITFFIGILFYFIDILFYRPMAMAKNHSGKANTTKSPLYRVLNQTCPKQWPYIIMWCRLTTCTYFIFFIFIYFLCSKL